jgi:hypothetical protein
VLVGVGLVLVGSRFSARRCRMVVGLGVGWL